MTYTHDQWCNALNEASGYSYDDIDVAENVGPIGTAIVQAYETFEQDEEKITAVIEGCALQVRSWDIETFNKVVAGGVVQYDDWAEIMQDWLDDHAPEIKAEWLKEDCPLWSSLLRESELGVEITGNGVYVINEIS